jgi:hypothetical protein
MNWSLRSSPISTVDSQTIREVLDGRRFFTLVHFATASKIDISVLRGDEYSQVSFARRRFEQSRLFAQELVQFAIATAEDTILRKLEWYRAGGETSERQWNDLRGVVKVSGKTLDLVYLRHWAEYLKVDDLLERLLAE